MIEADLGAAILTSSPRATHSVSAAAKLAAVSMILKHMDSATVHPSSQTNPDELPRFVGFEENVVEGTKVVEESPDPETAEPASVWSVAPVSVSDNPVGLFGVLAEVVVGPTVVVTSSAAIWQA